MDERILSGVLQTAEADPEVTLRPRALPEFIGQPKLKETLGVFLQAARQRQEPLDHVLLSGPPGLGKTTLAHIIAREMGAQIRVTSGPVLEKAGDLAAILTNLAPGDVLFVDEIHRMPPAVEEILYPAMEDGKLDLVIGRGRAPARSSSVFRRSRSWAPRRAPASSRSRSRRVSASRTGSTSTTPRRSRPS